jgi:hypothetical protein
MHDALESVLSPLRPGFDADGFDVIVPMPARSASSPTTCWAPC